MKRISISLLLVVIFATMLSFISGCTGYKYVLSFDSMGGSPIENIKVQDASILQIPEPIREGYNFAGWYLSSDYEEKFDIMNIDSEIREIELFARWLEDIGEFVPDSELKFADISDLHYYPLYYCATGYTGEFREDNNKDAKMLVESSLAYEKIIEELLLSNIDLLLVCGDTSKDGERAAHIDVANGLRYLQNSIRLNNPNFQIFVTNGNHDLYSTSYSYENGNKVKTVETSRKEFSIIYSSLGYPDITEEEAAEFYTTEELSRTLLPYPTDGDAFINSSLASSYEFVYQYIVNGHSEEQDYAPGELSYIATSDNISVISVDENASETGKLRKQGILFPSVKVFMEDNKPEGTIMAMVHHSVVPHYSMEENLRSGFMMEDWREVADYLADYGVHYVFTGHMHANDIAYYTSYNNNRIIDIQVSGNPSADGAIGYGRLIRGNLGIEKGENFYFCYDILQDVDFSKAIEGGFINQTYINDNNVSGYLNLDNGVVQDMSGYYEAKTYNMYRSVIRSYLDYDFIYGMLDSASESIGEYMPGVVPLLDKIVENLLTEIDNKILPDYTYGGSDSELIGAHKIIPYFLEFIDSIIGVDYSGDKDLIELLVGAFMAHLRGGEAPSAEALEDDYKQLIMDVEDGTLLNYVIGRVMDDIYPVIHALLITPLDITAGFSESEIRTLNFIDTLLLGGQGIFNPSRIVLNDLIPAIIDTLDIELPIVIDKPITDFLDEYISEYTSDYMIEDISAAIGNILLSLYVDTSPEGVNGDIEAEVLLKFDVYEEVTYSSRPLNDIPTVMNGKLPSMLTITPGSDASTSVALVWFTDTRVTGSSVAYCSAEAWDISNAVIINGESEIYATTFPLIDIGIYTTTGIYEIRRHVVYLDGLAAGMKYRYVAGDIERGYLTIPQTFQTAPENGEFEALIMSDMFIIDDSSYQKVANVLSAADKRFNYELIINTGNSVNDSRNIWEYGYILSDTLWANTLTATGFGSEIEYFSSGNYVPSQEGVKIDAYNIGIMHYAIDDGSSEIMYYSFDYSAVHFTMLSSNDFYIREDGSVMSEAQYDWLINDIKNSEKSFNAVVIPECLFPNVSGNENAMAISQALEDILSEIDIDIVFMGGNTGYIQSYRMKNGEKTHNTSYKLGDGTVFVALGSIGNRNTGEVKIESAYLYGECDPTFGLLSYNGNELYYRGYEYMESEGEIMTLRNNAMPFIPLLCAVGFSFVMATALFIINRRKILG